MRGTRAGFDDLLGDLLTVEDNQEVGHHDRLVFLVDVYYVAPPRPCGTSSTMATVPSTTGSAVLT
jgi:hypothetical protein